MISSDIGFRTTRRREDIGCDTRIFSTPRKGDEDMSKFACSLERRDTEVP